MVRLCSLLVSALLVSGCAEQLDETPQAMNSVKKASFNAEGAPTVEFSVPDMMCPEGCGEKTKEILAEQPGAKDVMIDFESKRAVVAVEPETFDADAALAAMVDHGFNQTTVPAVASAAASH
jgi:copper chaperone CopZ